MSSDPEFKPGGGVPDGPMHVSLQDGEPIVRADVTAFQFMRFMAEQDPERLERDRAEAWGCDPTRLSPDAMTVTFDRTDVVIDDEGPDGIQWHCARPECGVEVWDPAPITEK